MKYIKIFRYGLWSIAGCLAIFLVWDSINPPQQASRSSTLIIDQYASPLPEVSFTEHPWQVVNFFASWCAPCRVEHPLLVELAKELPIIGVSWKDPPADSQKFLDELGNVFQQVIFDPDGSVTRPWRIEGLPATFLIDASGKIRYRRLGLLSDGHIAQMRSLIKNAKQ